MDNKTDTIWVKGAEFRRVRTSGLKRDMRILEYRPKTPNEVNLKKRIEVLIYRRDVPGDFLAPTMEPSFDDRGRIEYRQGSKVASGKFYSSWVELAKEVSPEMKSRLGTPKQHTAFMAAFISELHEEFGMSLDQAWGTACSSVLELDDRLWRGYDGKVKRYITGDRKLGNWFDLADNAKILSTNEMPGGACFVGGVFREKETEIPSISSFHWYDGRSDIYTCATGWVVLNP